MRESVNRGQGGKLPRALFKESPCQVVEAGEVKAKVLPDLWDGCVLGEVQRKTAVALDARVGLEAAARALAA